MGLGHGHGGATGHPCQGQQRRQLCRTQTQSPFLLYGVSALFGLFQGGIVPCYALIVREYFPASQAGSRTGIIIFATLLGMAFGAWVSGVLYDMNGSYSAAFVHAAGWNLINIIIVGVLLLRARHFTHVGRRCRRPHGVGNE